MIQLVSFPAKPARCRKAVVTVVLDISPVAMLLRSDSGVDSVIEMTSDGKSSLARPVTLSGRSFGRSGTAGCTAAKVSSRCFCIIVAMSCHDDSGTTRGIVGILKQPPGESWRECKGRCWALALYEKDSN